MFKKLFVTISLCLLSSLTLAQPHIEQKTLLINSQDKAKVHAYQEQVKIKIDKHRTEMRARKEVLEHEKESLRNDIRSAKQSNNGKLSEEQKSDFKSRRDAIESKILQLRQENNQFMEQIDKEREIFFSSLKKQP